MDMTKLFETNLDDLETLEDATYEALPEEYKPVNQLNVPEEAKLKFAQLGFDLQWVRIYVPASNGQIDLRNVQVKEGDFYEFVRRDEIPGLKKAMTGYFGDQVTQNVNDLYVVGELALAKFPKQRQKQKRQYFDQITKARSQALISDLKRNSLMPSVQGDVYKTERAQPKAKMVDFGE
jgi:hypothetical protein